MDFNLPIAPSGTSGEDQYHIGATISSEKGESRDRQLSTRRLIDSSFPSQGSAQPAHMGSQSRAPDKSDGYDNMYTYTSDPMN